MAIPSWKTGRARQKFDAELEELAEDMFASMYAAQGVDWRRRKLEKSLRLAVVDVTAGKSRGQNRAGKSRSDSRGSEVREEEGCFRFRAFGGYVMRPQFVTIKAQNAKGEAFEIRGENLLARAFCHEIDHLNGFFFATPQHAEARLIRRKIKKLRKQGEW